MFTSQLPAGYKFSFTPYLFNTAKHRMSQANSGWVTYYWLKVKAKQVKAEWSVHIYEYEGRSPLSATFGGIEFDDSIKLKELTDLVLNASKEIISRQVNRISVTLPPQVYNNQRFVKAYQAFSDAGYSAFNSQVVASLTVSEHTFKSKIHKSEVKKLKKAEGLGFCFLVESVDSLFQFYDLIAASRRTKGRNLSLTRSQLEEIISYQPDKFHLYSVRHNDKLVAAAICIQLSEEVFYVFYADHLKTYSSVSPIVQLYQGIYEDCQSKGVKILDFGTSPEGSTTNYSLLDFKEYLGSELSLKVTFVYNGGA